MTEASNTESQVNITLDLGQVMELAFCLQDRIIKVKDYIKANKGNSAEGNWKEVLAELNVLKSSIDLAIENH